MSNRPTSSDIEDVLGSIRRLVSEEAAARTKTPRQRDRLVLTPAFRVNDPAQEGQGGGAPEAPVARDGSAAGAASGASITEELAELEARMIQKAERWKDEEELLGVPDGAVAEVEEPWAEAEVTAPAAAGPEAAAEDAVADLADGAPETLEPVAETDDEAQAALNAALVDEEVVTEAAEPPASTVEEPAAVAGTAAEEVEAEAAEEPSLEAAGETASAGAEVAETGPEEGSAEAADAAPATEEAAADALESQPEAEAPIPEATLAEADEPTAAAAEAEAYDAWEPAGEEGQPAFRMHGAETVLEEPPIEAQIVRLATAAPLPEAAENLGKPDIESLLDETELRALVAEVLREELKGPLGERITRNVRKLVRREIAQALSSLDID